MDSSSSVSAKVPSRKALNEIRAQWRTGRPGKITDTSSMEKKAWKKQLQTQDMKEEDLSQGFAGKRWKDFHACLPLMIDGEWSGHTFASFSHRFYLTSHMSQTTNRALKKTDNTSSSVAFAFPSANSAIPAIVEK